MPDQRSLRAAPPCSAFGLKLLTFPKPILTVRPLQDEDGVNLALAQLTGMLKGMHNQNVGP